MPFQRGLCQNEAGVYLAAILGKAWRIKPKKCGMQHTCMSVSCGPHTERTSHHCSFHFWEGAKRNWKESMFYHWETHFDTKGNMHCLSKECRCPVPKEKLCKNSLCLEWPDDKEVSLSRGRSADIQHARENWCWPFSPSKPQVDVKATPQSLPHLPWAILLPKSAFLVQSSHRLTHIILEDSRKPGQLKDTQRKLETPFPHYIQHHEPLGRPWLWSHETCFFPWTSVF